MSSLSYQEQHWQAPAPLSPSMLVPPMNWEVIRAGHHVVQFYEADAFLIESLGYFLQGGLAAGDCCIVLATPAHLADLAGWLDAQGVNPGALHAAGHYIPLSATEVLPQLLVNGTLERARFTEIIGGLIKEVSEGGRSLRVFGELVALLWADGNQEGAIQLEALWNELLEQYPFSLFCAYPLSGFDGTALSQPLTTICTHHSHIIPAESYSAITTVDERLQTILLLQQQARLLQAEIAERREAEAALEIQVEDLRQLHERSARMARTLDIETVLHEVLQAALSVQRTEMGALFLYDPQQGLLQVRVSQGLDAHFLHQLERVPVGQGASGLCCARRQPIIVEEVSQDPTFAPYLEFARAMGLHASHSIPLIARSGTLIGVLTLYFRHPHRPSEREQRLMDLYTQMAANSIENARLHQQLQEELSARNELLAREHRARAEAESANRMKDEFLATVSHELRTPLTTILGWSHRLRQGTHDENTLARGLDTIARSARIQAQLVEDLLDISRIIAGKVRLSIGPVDMVNVLHAVLDSMQVAAEAKEIRLVITSDPSARHLMGDADRLQQVFWNLLSNAIKFTPPGGRVEVRLGRHDRSLQIEVSDTGEGIEPDFLPYVFDYFRQADGSSTRRHSGLGLGLAIVRHLVELHGGKISVSSAGNGQGTTFTLRFPLATPGAPVREETLPVKTPVNVLAGVKILLVEDDRESLQLLTLTLMDYGAEVQAVRSAAEAWERLHWYRPDVIISDLAMPEEDGYSLIEQVRATERTREIPAIALTAYSRVTDRLRALTAGFTLFVPKPVEPGELLSILTMLLKG